MIQSGNKEDVYALIQEVKQRSTQYVTNYFIDQEKLSVWLAGGLFYYLAGEHGVLFFRKDRDFYHLYYSAVSLQGLGQLLAMQLPTEVIVTDLIGKKQDVEVLQGIFAQAGYLPRITMDRFTRINKEGTENYQPSGEVVFAGAEHIAQVSEMMDTNFDKYSDQIYTLQEVAELVNKKNILVVTDGPNIKGFLIRHILPQSSVLNNFLVKETYRGEKIGSKLLKHYIHESRNTKRLWLWVVSDNDHAINVYKSHGFAHDGLVDLVMIKNHG